MKNKEKRSEKMYTRFFIVSISFYLSISSLCAQSSSQVIDYANHLFARQNYLGALTEYQRAWVFNEDERLNTLLFDQISETHKYLGNTDQALKYKELAFKSAQSDTVRTDLMLETIPFYLGTKRYNDAVRLLLACKVYSQTTQDERSLYLGTIYFKQGKYDRAGTYFSSIISDSVFLSQRLSSRLLERPKQKVAQGLSYVVPGAGQVYAGDVQAGLNSTLLVCSIIGVGVILYQTYTLASAALAVGPLYYRYYLGGVKNAGSIAVKQKQINQNKVLQQILTEVARVSDESDF